MNIYDEFFGHGIRAKWRRLFAHATDGRGVRGLQLGLVTQCIQCLGVFFGFCSHGLLLANVFFSRCGF